MTSAVSQTVNDYLAAWTSGHAAEALALVTDDFSFRGPAASTTGKEAFRSVLRHISPAARGMRMLRQWVAGDVCSLYDFDVEAPDGPATVRISEVNTVRDGLVDSSLMIFDATPFQA